MKETIADEMGSVEPGELCVVVDVEITMVQTSRMKVLVAEDDPVSRAILESRLEKWSYDVVSATDGAEAARVLSSPDPPRLVILDWMMPGKDGVELCHEIRKREGEPYSYVVLLTARGERANIIEGLDAGADDYITKPFDAHELRVRLRAGQRILELQEQLIEAREELRERAIRDPLTRVLNRGAILDLLSREVARGERERLGLAVVMADLDHFKSVNDQHGHPAGDRVLEQIAQAMDGSIRPYDGLGRYGGEEFLFVLPGAPLEGARHQAERIRNRVANERVRTPAGELGVTMSMGVAAMAPGEPCTAETLIQAADDALYRAKASGRDRVETSCPTPITQASSRELMHGPLRMPAAKCGA